MHMRQSDLSALCSLLGDPQAVDFDKTLVLSKQEIVILKRARAICEKAARLLGTDDEYWPDTNCPFLMAASELGEIDGV